MAESMRVEFEKKMTRLETAIRESNLSTEERELISKAMAFGYAAAYCAKTCDVSGASKDAQRYISDYQRLMALVESH